MDMPKPGDAHKKLAALVGTWSGDEKLHPSPWAPQGSMATGHVTNRWILDGFAVLQEYEQRHGNHVTFRGHGVLWFDPSGDEYVMHWWDSMGGSVSEFRGRFEGDSLALTAPMPQGGRSRSSWTLKGADGHDFLMEVSPDGESWVPAMEGQYRKGQPAAARTPARRKKPVRKPASRARAVRPTRATKAATRKTATRKAGSRKAATRKAGSRKAATRKTAKAKRRTSR